MYNPNNNPLPNDHNDPMLTRYIWSYVVVLTAAFPVADEDDQTEELEISRVRCGTTKFHVMPSPQIEYNFVDERVYLLEDLRVGSPNFDEVREEAQDILRAPGSVEDWYEASLALDPEFTHVKVFEVRVKFSWEIRGWPGLTLDYALAELHGNNFEFERSWYLPAGAELLDEGMPSEGMYQSLRFASPELGATLALALYRSDPSPDKARDAARYLYEYKDLALAQFHFPELELCDSCLEEFRDADELYCETCIVVMGEQ